MLVAPCESLFRSALAITHKVFMENKRLLINEILCFGEDTASYVSLEMMLGCASL